MYCESVGRFREGRQWVAAHGTNDWLVDLLTRSNVWVNIGAGTWQSNKRTIWSACPTSAQLARQPRFSAVLPDACANCDWPESLERSSLNSARNTSSFREKLSSDSRRWNKKLVARENILPSFSAENSQYPTFSGKSSRYLLQGINGPVRTTPSNNMERNEWERERIFRRLGLSNRAT